MEDTVGVSWYLTTRYGICGVADAPWVGQWVDGGWVVIDDS